ncbi:glutathione S-transferase T3-like [Zingiber officinale]|uniref:glutathione S-transferase T3-like n=1 Tax=Zingiber officinale TaxID=94328 RepID=UPI001C4BE736|nr:glutathione S-transferase T3-like [Zingiber officinale]
MGNVSDEDHSKRTIWTVADDKLLAAAYTIMSKDSVVGNAQKSESFWKRVVTYFNANRTKGAKKRTAEKAKSHWASLKKIVNRYNGIYNKWYNDQPSRWSNEDLMVRAHEEYKKRRATKKARTSESSGAHTDSSNPNTTADIDDREI